MVHCATVFSTGSSCPRGSPFMCEGGVRGGIMLELQLLKLLLNDLLLLRGGGSGCTRGFSTVEGRGTL